MTSKKKFGKKKKKAIIEPLYKPTQPAYFIQEKFITATINIILQKEFNALLLPLVDLSEIFAEKLTELKPDILDTPPNPNDPDYIELYDQALIKTAKEFLAKDDEFIDNIMDNLLAINERLKAEPDKMLEKDVQLVIDFFKHKHSPSEIALFPLTREIILKHFTVFNEFTLKLEEEFGQSFPDFNENDPQEFEKYFEIVNAFDDRYPGFFEMLIGETDDDDEEELNLDEIEDVINQGIAAVVDGEFELDLFTKQELDKGLESAKQFYRQLSDSDKEKLRSFDARFNKKAKEFSDILSMCLIEVCTHSRLKQMGKKLQRYQKNPKYGSWYYFLDILKTMVAETNEMEMIITILTMIYTGQLRRVNRDAAQPYALLFWYL